MVDHVSNEELWKRTAIELVKPVMAAIDGSTISDEVSIILRQFMDQVLNTAWVVAHLDRSYKAEWGAEGAVLLRRAYDITFQAMYLVKDQSEALEKARDYTDYLWIDRVKSIRELDDSASEGLAFAIETAQSPKRKLIEPDIKNKYVLAMKRQKKRYGKKRPYWYGQNLKELANNLDLLHEYRFIIRNLHAITHNAPSVKYSASMSNQDRIPVWMVEVARRVMKCNIDYHHITLEPELDDCFVNVYQDIHNRYG